MVLFLFLWYVFFHSRSPLIVILSIWVCFFYDESGVIWKGDTLIDGVSQTLDLLRSKASSLSHSVSLWFWFWFLWRFCRVKTLSLWRTTRWNRGGNTLKSFDLWVSPLLLRLVFSDLCCLDRVSCVCVYCLNFFVCFIERMRYSLRRLRRLCTSKPTISPRTRRFVSSYRLLLAYCLGVSVVIFSFCRFMWLVEKAFLRSSSLPVLQVLVVL